MTDINFGIWEGLSLKQVEDRYPAEFAVWRTSPEKHADRGRRDPGRGEGAHIEGLARTAGPAGAVVVVTHRATCKVLVLSLLHMGNEHFWAMKYDPGSISLLEGEGTRFTLIFSNDTCHQRDGLQGAGYRDF